MRAPRPPRKSVVSSALPPRVRPSDRSRREEIAAFEWNGQSRTSVPVYSMSGPGARLVPWTIGLDGGKVRGESGEVTPNQTGRGQRMTPRADARSTVELGSSDEELMSRLAAGHRDALGAL